MATAETNRFAPILTALRGLLMLVAALLAFFYPTQTVKFLILAGGGLLLIDGAFGLAALKFSGPKTNSFWLGLARNALCIAAGLIVLFSPLLLNVFTLSFLAGFVGLLAVLVGILEIGFGLMDREKLWPALIGGVLYIVFGLALLFVPLSSAVVLIRIVTVLVLLYALLLFYRVWRLIGRG